MDENQIPQEPLPDQQASTEPDLQESAVEPEAVETRGLAWVIVPALLGLAIGALVGLAQTTGPVAAGVARMSLFEGALAGGTIGLIAGGVFGLLIWVVFPYKGRNPHAYQPEEQPTKATPEGTDEHGG